MSFKSICAGVCTAGFLFLSVQGALLVRDLRTQTLPQLTLTARDLDQSAKDLDKSVQNLNVLIDSSATVVDNVNSAAVQQQQFLVVESKEFLKTTAALKQFVQGLDINLNRPETGILPKVSLAVDQQNAALLALQKQSTDTLAHTQVVVDGLVPIEKHIDDTTVVVATTVAQVGPEFVGASKSIHGAADDGKEVADAYRDKLLHPFKSVWGDISTAANAGLKILQAIYFWP